MQWEDSLIKKGRILRVATADKHGNPHVVPVWYLYSKKKFYIGTNSQTRKARNVMENGSVSLCIDEGVDSPHIFGFMCQGKAVLIVEKSRVLRMAKKILLRYFENLDGGPARELLRDTDCIIEIVPQNTARWKY